MLWWRLTMVNNNDIVDNSKSCHANHNEYLESYIKCNISNYKNITIKTMMMYEKQCAFLKKQIKILKKIQPLSTYKTAYLKWQKELNNLEDCYEKAFDKYLEEKKELDNISRLY